MANTSTIVDNFDDNSINTGIWSANYGTTSETGGRARITCSTAYSGYATGTVYTWDDVYAQLYPPALASATAECYLEMLLYSAGQAGGTDVGFYIDQTAGQFYCVSRTGYFDGTASAITYSATTHAWMRILKSGSNILFQTAPDGTTWTTRRTLAAPAWLTAATDLQLFFESHRNNGTNNFAEVDNVNTLGVAATATRGPTVVTPRPVTVKGAFTLVRPVPDIPPPPPSGPTTRAIVAALRPFSVKGSATLVRPVPDIPPQPPSGPTTRAVIARARDTFRRGAALLVRPMPVIVAPVPVVAPPAYGLLIDWNGDGDFSDTGEDVTARALDQRTPVNSRVGRDQARALSPISPGTAGFELNNVSRDYSPDNASSPLAELVRPGRSVLWTADYDSVTYTLYRGYTDDFSLRPDYAERSIGVTCLDALGQLNSVTLTTEMFSGVRTGTAIGYVLDAAGWPADMRDIDPGASVLPWWWLDATVALTALLELVDSEGPAALLTVDGDGKIVFRDRHHRLLRATSNTVQATWRSSGAEPLVSSPAAYNHGWKEIINDVAFDVTVRRPDAGRTVVWSTDDRITIASGDVALITARAVGGFFGALVPVEDTDFTAASGSVVVTMSRTSGQSTTIQLAASGGAAVVTGLQLRAIALGTSSMTVAGEDSTSISTFGRRSMPDTRAPIWASPLDAAAIVNLILGKRSTRVTTMQLSIKGGNIPERLAEIFGRDLSDRVHVVEEHSGLDADCFVEQIAHTATQGGAEHTTTFGVERAPDAITNPFTFGVAGKGFNDGVFIGTGHDDPSTMFLFGVAGQGFTDGVFAN